MKETSGAGSVRARFSAAAGTYDEHAWVQADAARRLVELMEPLDEPDALLEVGCGTGQLTRRLLNRFRRTRIDAVDVAPAMVRRARRVVGGEGRVEWFTEDARAFAPGRRYACIAANCSLHWLDPLPATLRHLVGLLRERGVLVAAVMLDGTLRELHAARRRAAPKKVPGGKLPSAALLRESLEGAGLRIETFREEETVVVCPSVEELIAQLRRQGLTGGAVSRAAMPLNRGELRELAGEYRRRYAEDGGVRATYRVAYARAVREG